MFRFVIFHVAATLSSLHLRHSSFPSPSVVSPTSQLILKLFRSFTYVVSTSSTPSGEPPKIYNDLYIDFIYASHCPIREGQCDAWQRFNCVNIVITLVHGCANHDTEGKRFNSPIHCCDTTRPPYLFSGELCTSPLHCELLFVYIMCCRRTGQCFSVLRTHNSDVILP